MSKKLIYMDDFSKEEIYEIFKLADKLAEDWNEAKPLEGKTILFPPSALDKKEKTEDVIGYLENWVDAVVVRHNDIKVVKNMAEYASIPVINAMTSENHPCEIIADLYALSKLYNGIENKKFLFVGARGNIGNSWKKASELIGFELEQCCPVGYELENVKFHTDLEDAVLGKDIICTDSVPDKAQVDFKEYQITLRHMKKANKGAVLNPCPPFFRGKEVSEDVINSDYFVGYEFKKYLVEVQQAILCYLLEQ